MRHSEGMIAQYNATLPTIVDGEGGHLQLTSKGILYVTPSKSDGSSVVVAQGQDVSTNSNGFIAYGINDGNQSVAHSMDDNGYLRVNVMEGTINIDFTPGIDRDFCTDEDGANAYPGMLEGITQSWSVVASKQIPNGETWALTSWNNTCDNQGIFQLVLVSGGGGTIKYIRTMNVPEFAGANEYDWNRPRELTAADDGTFLQVRARCPRVGKDMVASSGVNVYKQV